MARMYKNVVETTHLLVHHIDEDKSMWTCTLPPKMISDQDMLSDIVCFLASLFCGILFSGIVSS